MIEPTLLHENSRQPERPRVPQRSQVAYPLDQQSVEAIKRGLEGPDPTVEVNTSISNPFRVTDPAVYLVDASGDTVTMNLPQLEGVQKGVRYDFKKTDSSTNNVILDGFENETIDDATTLNITTQHENVTIVSDGNNWRIV